MQPPYITTRQMLANDVAKNWQRTYRDLQAENNTGGLAEIAARVALGDNPTSEQIDALGLGRHIILTCNQCGKDVDTIITVGEVSDWDSSTADLCLECIEKVHSMALTIGK